MHSIIRIMEVDCMKKFLACALSFSLALSGVLISPKSTQVASATETKSVVSIKDEEKNFNTTKSITVVPLQLYNAVAGGDWNPEEDYSTGVGESGDYVAYRSDSCGTDSDQYHLDLDGKNASIENVGTRISNNGTFTLPEQITVYRLASGDKTYGTDDEGNQKYGSANVINPVTGNKETLSSKYIYSVYKEVYNVYSVDNSLRGNSVFTGKNITVVIPDSVLQLNTFAEGNTKIGRVYGDSVTNIGGGSFSDCTNMTDMYFPNCKVVENDAFSNCVSLGKQGDSLTNIQFPKVHTVGSNAFEGCTSLVKVNLGTTLQSLGSSAFENCTSLEDIDLTGGTAQGSQGTNTISTIPNNCFSGCTNLKNIKITERLVNIGSNAFSQCDMGDFKFENTKLQKIESNAFSGCTNLSYASLPDTVTEVGNGAFSNCYKLRYLYSINPDINENVVSPLYTVLEIGKMDTKSGIVAKDDSYLDISDKNIYSGGTIKLVDDMNDIDYSSIKITKDGKEDKSIELSEFLDKRSIKTGLKAYSFDIEQGDEGHGTYTISFSDVAGNEKESTFKYENDVEDVTPPKIEVDGSSLDGTCYKSGVEINCTDDLGIEEILLNGKSVEEESFTLTEDGTYNIEVIDSNGNSVEKTVIVDSKAPEILGVDEAVSDDPYKIKVVDANIYKVTLNDKDITKEATSDGYQINMSNKYTVKALDKAGNKSEKSFIYSANGVTLRGVKDDGVYNRNVTISWDSYVKITSATLQLGKGSEFDIQNGYVCKENGEYTLNVTDELNKRVSISFTIDKVAPKVTGVKNGKYYRDSVSFDVKDDTRYTVYDGDKEVSTSFSDEKYYSLRVVDEAGNTTWVKFGIDNTKPKMSVKNKAKIKKGKTVKFKDKSGIKSVTIYRKAKKSGKYKKYKTLKGKTSYKFKKVGYYKLTIKDKSGLSVKRYLTVKKK